MAGITRKTYTSNDLMLMQGYVDKANEVVAILEANADVMKSLSNFYSKLPDNHGFGDDLAAACKDPISEFSAQIGDMIYDAKMQIRRARLLVKITSDRKALVRLIRIYTSHVN